jgi:hypothetical protein
VVAHYVALCALLFWRRVLSISACITRLTTVWLNCIEIYHTI